MTDMTLNRTRRRHLRTFLRRSIFLAKLILPTGETIDDMLNFIHAWVRLGYVPHISSPRSLNEHILSNKRHFRDDLNLAKRLTDKRLFKEWMQEKGYGDQVIPTLGLYNSVDEVRHLVFDKNTILKPTHLSGVAIPIRESRRLSDHELSKAKKALRTDYYRRSREKNYEGVDRRLICEPLLLDSSGNIPMDYKFFMCRGQPFMIQVDLDRFTNHTRQLYSTDWELLNIGLEYPRNTAQISKPDNLGTALDIASAIARDFSICRVDLYLLPNNVIKAGEITFFPEGGGGRFSPSSADFEIGAKVKEILRVDE